MPYQPPTFIPAGQVFQPSGSPSPWEGLAGVLAQFAAQQQRRKAMEAEQERLSRGEARAEDAAAFQRAQQQIQQQLMLRQRTAEEAKLLETQPAPTVELPPDQAGPPALAPVPEVTLPPVYDPMSGRQLLAPGGLKPRFREDVLEQQRAEGDIQTQQKAEQAAAVAEATLPSQLALEEQRGVASATVRAEAAKEAARVRAEERGASAAARAAEAATARREKQEAASEAQAASLDEAAAALEGGATVNSLPIKLRAQAANEARKRGARVYDTPQTKAKVTDYDELRDKAARLKELLDKPNVQSFVGPIAGRATGMISALPETPFTKVPPEVDEMRTLMKDLSDTELRKRSGAAITEKEFDRVLAFAMNPDARLQPNRQNVERMLGAIDKRIQTLTGLAPGGKAKGKPMTVAGFEVVEE